MATGRTPLRQLIKLAAPDGMGFMDSMRNNRMEEYLGLPTRRAPMPVRPSSPQGTSPGLMDSLKSNRMEEYFGLPTRRAPMSARPSSPQGSPAQGTSPGLMDSLKSNRMEEYFGLPTRRSAPPAPKPLLAAQQGATSARAVLPTPEGGRGPAPGSHSQAIANAARQIARSVGFRPVGKGTFNDDARADQFISRNPRFSELARKQLGL